MGKALANACPDHARAVINSKEDAAKRKSQRRPSKRDWARAGLALLEEKGVSGVTIIGLAKSLGVSGRSFYRQFSGLSELRDSILKYWEEVLTDNITAAARPESVLPAERIYRLMVQVIERDAGRYDHAILVWARSDAKAKAAFDRTMGKRFEFTAWMFSRAGFSKRQAELRGRLLVTYLMGESSAGLKSNPDWLNVVRDEHEILMRPPTAATGNDILSELAAERDREESKRSEIARMAQLTTMEEMAASIAHEVNQPLAAIVANTKAAERWLSRLTPDIDEALTCLKDIAVDGRRASEIIDSVRAMFKKDAAERSAVDINEVMKEVLALLRTELLRSDVVVLSDLGSELPQPFVNRVQLQQVFMNLVINAVEAMKRTDRARVLRVRSDTDASGHVITTVQDTGPGITPENQSRIFEAFFTTKSTGTGLGLSICKSIVEAHGGTLTAASAPEQGTIFTIVLPTGLEND
jgi:signal transduction histidine kinase